MGAWVPLLGNQKRAPKPKVPTRARKLDGEVGDFGYGVHGMQWDARILEAAHVVRGSIWRMWRWF
jgi:hypothetical protein